MTTVIRRWRETSLTLGALLLSVLGASAAAVLGFRAEVIAVSLAFGIVFVIAVKQPRYYISLFLILYMVSTTPFGHTSSTLQAAVRIGGLLILAIACLRQRASSRKISKAVGVTLTAGSGAYVAVLIIHGLDRSAISAALLYATAGILLALMAKRVSILEIEVGTKWVLSVSIIASLLLGIFIPSHAIVANRLSGIFANPNTLGFFCGIGLTVSIVTARERAHGLLFLVSAMGLIWSGSRSALLAFGVALALSALRVVITKERRRAFWVAGAGAAVAGLSVVVADPSELLILRMNDSRGSGTEYALQVASTKLWTGVGYGHELIEIASTPLRWLVEGGMVSCLAILLAYAASFVISWRMGWSVFFVAVYGIVSSTFEGWFVSGGSSLFVTFWLVYIASVRPPADRDSSERGDASTDAGLRLVGPIGTGLPRHLYVRA